MQMGIKQMNNCFNQLWQKHNVWVILLMTAFLFNTLKTIHFMVKESVTLEVHPLVYNECPS